MKRLAFVSILTFLISGFATGCGQLNGSGSGSGFPYGRSEGTSSANAGTSSVAQAIANTSCETLVRCFQVDNQQCVTAHLAMTTFAPKLGLKRTLSLEAIRTLELNSALIAVYTTSTHCLTALRSRACSAASATYAQAPDMLDSVCLGIFSDQ